MDNKRQKHRIHRSINRILLGLIFVFIVGATAIFLRLYVIASYHVSTPSMEPTIMPGDYILVNQLLLGARYFKKNVVKRVPGFCKIKRNDILVFNFPHLESMDIDVSVHYVKRCVAIAGDSLYIKNGFYRVIGLPDTLGFVDYQLRLSVLDRSFLPWGSWRTIPKDPLHEWTVKEMGPIYIPERGDTVPLSKYNIGLYSDAIAYESKQKIEIRADTILLEKSQLVIMFSKIITISWLVTMSLTLPIRGIGDCCLRIILLAKR